MLRERVVAGGNVRLQVLIAGLSLTALLALVVDRHVYWIASLLAIVAWVSVESVRAVRSRIDAERQRQLDASNVRLAIIETLVLAIDAEHPMAAIHLRRLKVCAQLLAHAVGLEEHDVQAITTAALLHDIGNLAVPAHVLGKRASLTAEEFDKVKTHARVGAEILESVPFPTPVCPLILAHHERWDGGGYPKKLRGEAIPVGARVLAVADTFTALLADRPHRRGYSMDAATTIVRERAGSALDPALVDRLLALLPTLEQEFAALGDPGPVDGDPLASVASASRTAHEEIAATHREAESLGDIAQALGSSMGVFDTMMLVWLKIQKLLPVSCCALFLWNEQASRYECRFAAGENDAGVRRRTAARLEGLCDPVEPQGLLLTPDAWGTRLQSGLASRLALDDDTLGALVLYHAEAGVYGMEHRRLLARISQQAALVLRTSMVFDRTRADSLKDPLTGVANRRALGHYLQRELPRASQRADGASLLLCDLDGFKQVNDRYGHDVGDRALQAVARTLQAQLAPQEFCARLAGDEFVVALPGTSRDQARHRAERIREAVAAIELTAPSGAAATLGVSIGIATCPEDGKTAAQLTAAADRRMYDDKMAGRQSSAMCYR